MSDEVVTESAPAAPEPSRIERALSAIQSPAPFEPASAPIEAPPAAQEPDHGVHAKALALAQRKEREAFEAKAEAKRYQAELDQLKSAAEARKKLNPLELLKAEHGLDYAGLTKAIVEKQFADKTPEQQALSAHEQELKVLKEKLEAYEAEKQAAQQQSIEQQNLAHIASELKAHEADYALVAALPGDHAKAILARYTSIYRETGEEPDLHDILKEYESAAQRDVDALFSSDAVLKKYLASEANKTRVLALLGVAKPTPQQVQQARPGLAPNLRAHDPGPRSAPIIEANPKSRLERALQSLNSKV